MKPPAGSSIAIIVLMICCQVSIAQIPRTLSYQGVLTDSLGHPKPDGSYTLTFRLYNQESGGSALWTESKTLEVRRGLFSTLLGDQVLFGPAMTFEAPYWLGVQVAAQPELSPRIPLSSVGYSLNSLRADTARYAAHAPVPDVVDSARISGTVKDGSITSTKIQNGTILFADMAQNGAASGEVMKWTGSAWAAAPDATGGGSGASGWTDNGTSVSLTNPGDTVSLSTSSRLGKLNINGDIGLNLLSSVYFGSQETYLRGLMGGDLRLRAEDDLYLAGLEDIGLTAARSIDLAAAEGVYFGASTSERWALADNSRKRLGIGTLDPSNRLHVVSNDRQSVFTMIEGTHSTQWGQAGLAVKTPQNMWELSMDTYLNFNFPDGALSLHSQNGATQAMTWLEDGRVGIGTVNPTRKLHVYGSAQVKDTLYAGTVNAAKIMNAPGVAHGSRAADIHISNKDTWKSVDSVSIQAPGRGYVIMLLSGSMHVTHTLTRYTQAYFGISATPDGSDLLQRSRWVFDPSLSSGPYAIPVAIHGIASVPSGGVYSYYLVVYELSVGGTGVTDDITMDNVEMSLLFIPYAYGPVETSSSAFDLSMDGMAPEGGTASGNPYEARLDALTAEVQALRAELTSRPR